MERLKGCFAFGSYTIGLVAIMAVFVCTSLVNAKASDTVDQVEMACETILACQQLSESLQAQVDELEAKGIENLTNDEFEQYAELTDELIAVENQWQQEQQETIAVENEKQEQMRLAQEQEIIELRDKIIEH